MLRDWNKRLGTGRLFTVGALIAANGHTHRLDRGSW